MSPSDYKIAMVAGEASSDLLGAQLILDIEKLLPNTRIIAVGGARIKQTSATILLDNEVFSVMGLAEVIKDLPQLIKHKKQVVKAILDFKPDVFIGVDSPDLNFAIAKVMRKNHIPVIHYVSPSVWAWRPKRIFSMQKFIDRLFTLFPFEAELYSDTRIKASFVGHPLAQKIPLEVNKSEAKAKLKLTAKKVLALLPGSRNREIKSLVPLFAQTIKQLNLSADWDVISSNISAEKVALTQSLLDAEGLSVRWVDDTTELLKAADFTLLGSGTVALEAMLCKTPMVVGYHISPLTWWLVKTFNMMRLPYYSLPNVLSKGFMVPEVMQNDLTVENLCAACHQVMFKTDQAELVKRFHHIHETLLPARPNQAAWYLQQYLEDLC